MRVNDVRSSVVDTVSWGDDDDACGVVRGWGLAARAGGSGVRGWGLQRASCARWVAWRARDAVDGVGTTSIDHLVDIC